MDSLDPRSESNVATLLPAAQEKAREFMEKCATAMFPYTVKIICGTRTYEEQNELYKQGRETSGDIRTNARGGYSYHNFGIAFDVGIFDWQKKYIDELPESEISKASVDGIYRAAGEIGESIGLEWGGRWKSIVDLPHLQWNPKKLTIIQLREKHESGEAYI